MTDSTRTDYRTKLDFDTDKIAATMPDSYDHMKKSLSYVYLKPTWNQIATSDSGSCFTPLEYSVNAEPPVKAIPGLHTKHTCKINAGIYKANYEWNNPSFFPSSIFNNNPDGSKKIYTPGLKLTINKSGYFYGQETFFKNSKFNVVQKDLVTKFDNLTNATNKQILANGNNKEFSLEWKGFMVPDVAGLWRIGIQASNAANFWLGDSAKEAYYSSTNKLINAGSQTNVNVTQSVELTSRQEYAVRIQYGAKSGDHNFVLTIVDPNGKTRTDTEKLFCQIENSDSIGSQINSNFNTQNNIYYSLTQAPGYEQKNLFNCFISDRESNTKSEPGNYEYEIVWSTTPVTKAEDTYNASPSYYGYIFYRSFNAPQYDHQECLPPAYMTDPIPASTDPETGAQISAGVPSYCKPGTTTVIDHYQVVDGSIFVYSNGNVKQLEPFHSNGVLNLSDQGYLTTYYYGTEMEYYGPKGNPYGPRSYGWLPVNRYVAGGHDPVSNDNWAKWKVLNNITNQIDLSTGANGVGAPEDPTGIVRVLCISSNNCYKLEINRRGDLVIKRSYKGCRGAKAYDPNDGEVKYTAIEPNYNPTTLRDYYFYDVEVDKKINKVFFGQDDNDENKTLQYIEKKDPYINVNTNSAIELKDDFMKPYFGIAPSVDEMDNAVIVGSVDEAMQKCKSDPKCKYFYYFQNSKDYKYYLLKYSGDNFTPLYYYPISPGHNMLNSTLYLRNFKVTTATKDFRDPHPDITITDYTPFSQYTIKPFTSDNNKYIKENTNDDIHCATIAPMALQYLYYNGTDPNSGDPDMTKLYSTNNKRCLKKMKKDGYEGFENHGYMDSESVYNYYGTNDPKSLGLPDGIIQDQINPLNEIANDYEVKMKKVNTRFIDISNNINIITNYQGQGIRDDMSGNDFYDYNTPFTLNKPKTLVEGRIYDTKQLAAQDNAVYVLGTLTAATLIVFAIALARE